MTYDPMGDYAHMLLERFGRAFWVPDRRLPRRIVWLRIRRAAVFVFVGAVLVEAAFATAWWLS